MGLKVKRSPLNQPKTGSPNSPLLILTLTSTGSHPHLFLLPDSSSRTAAASPPLPPHPLPPPSSTSAAAHPCLLHLRAAQALSSLVPGARRPHRRARARPRPGGGRRAAAATRRAPGGRRLRLGERRADGERSCRAPGGRRQGEEWKSDADAQFFFPPGRLENLDCTANYQRSNCI